MIIIITYYNSFDNGGLLSSAVTKQKKLRKPLDMLHEPHFENRCQSAHAQYDGGHLHKLRHMMHSITGCHSSRSF